MRRELAYLDDMLECIAKIEEYLAGVDKTAFQTNRLLQDAVVLNLMIIGEAVKALPQTVTQKQPQIDWRGITRMRDKRFIITLPSSSMLSGQLPHRIYCL